MGQVPYDIELSNGDKLRFNGKTVVLIHLIEKQLGEYLMEVPVEVAAEVSEAISNKFKNAP